MTEEAVAEPEEMPKRGKGPWGRIIFVAITLACFAYLYFRISGAASREDLTVLAYMANVFAQVDWVTWMAIMVCYSLFYFLIDS